MIYPLIFLSLFFTVNSVSQFKVISCGISTDLMQSVKLSVDPILPVTNYKLFLDGELTANVTGGTSQYSVTYNFIPLSPTTNDLCTEINASNVTCPLSLGPFASESSGKITEGLSGTVTIKNQWFNENNQRILCMLFTIKI
jgi:hypothetical protein